MAAEPQHDLTALLKAWRGGDHAALDALLPRVFAELHRLAHFYMARERPGHVLQTSALVNEMYVRLLDARTLDWQDRAHFFGVCARLMRQVLVQHARARRARKRAGTAVRVEIDGDVMAAPERDPTLIALDEALSALAQLDPREAHIVEMRFFAGLNEDEIAHVLGISGRTVRREWDHAKSWLLRELQRGTPA
jgi:RNA polymerase sigma factor (TIGR02999 family)